MYMRDHRNSAKRFSMLLFGLLIAVCAGLSTRTYAFGKTSVNNQVAFTTNVAVDQANELASSLDEGEDLHATNPIGYYDLDGNPAGCMVNYCNADGSPHGFVIYDITDGLQLVEFSFADNAVSPYSKTLDAIAQNESLQDVAPSPTIVYELSPLDYCVADDHSSQAVTCDGEVVTLPDTAASTAKKESDWSDIFVPVRDGSSSYRYSNQKNLSVYYAWPESTIEGVTGKYCCAVSAMLVPIYYYTGCWSERLSNVYTELWNDSGTTTTSTSNGITFGSVVNSNIGPATVRFCANRSVAITSSYQSSPAYQSFVSTIDSGNVAIFTAGIIKSGGTRSGHAMAVEGCCTVQITSTGESWRTLRVFDGWYYNPAYVNYDFTGFTDTGGVFYAR